MKKKRYFHLAIWAILFLAACTSGNEGEVPGKEESESAETTIQVEVESFVDSSGSFEAGEAVTSREAGWLAYGMGGAIDPQLESARFVLDYVRVYALQ